MTRITKATFKVFVNKNRERLLIRCESSFDGMTDCVEQARNPQFAPAKDAERVMDHNLGINGIWLVGESRDYFRPFSGNGLEGIHVFNSCGSFTVAIKALT